MSVNGWLRAARSAGRLAAGFLGRDRRDAELGDELDFHITNATERVLSWYDRLIDEPARRAAKEVGDSAQ